MSKTKKIKNNKKYSYLDMFKIFKYSLREYKVSSILTMVFISLEALFECLIPFVMSDLIDLMNNNIGVDTSGLLNQVLIYSLILLSLAFCSLTCGLLAGIFSAKASVGFGKNLKHDIYYKIMDLSFENIDKFSSSSLVTRVTTDVFYIQNAFMMVIRTAIRGPLMIIFSFCMAAIKAPSMCWIYAITLPLLLIPIVLIIVNAIPRFASVFEEFDNLNESVEENVRGIRVVKTYVREDYEKEKFKNRSDSLKKNSIRAERLVALNTPIMRAVMSLSMALIIFIGAYVITRDGNTEYVNGEVVYNVLTVGEMSSLITYGSQILANLMMVSFLFVMISMSTASMRRVFEVLKETPVVLNKEDGLKEVDGYDIEFKNVSFKYNKNAQKYALSNVNLKIKEGETIGIVGGTGSSKSTLVNLISRFYDVTDGEILLGGKNIKDYDIRVLRNSVSMVLQKNVLFSGTVKENLKWGNKLATDEEIKEACRISQADSFIEPLKEQYEAKVEQGGANFSGGQKQRLCIARAILKNPKVLILDDSTSAVDTVTDAKIQKGLKSLLPNTTKIIIAQRLTSVMSADHIIVMDNGEINGYGTHEELLNTNAIYKDIYSIQNRIGGK